MDRRREVRELYARLAASYDEVYGRQQALKYWLVSSLAGERVLDAGCGTGISMEVLKAYVVCLDISPEMLARARGRAGMWGDPVIGDLFVPPFRRGAFTSALFLSVLEPEEFTKAIEAVRGIARLAILEFRGSWKVASLEAPLSGLPDSGSR